MHPAQLLVRCYAERVHGQWQAFCLDLSLGAQADTFEEARQKLDAQIREYICDAVAGPDSAHVSALLTRRAPLRFWLKYWLIAVLSKVHRDHDEPRKFAASLPLVPVSC